MKAGSLPPISRRSSTVTPQISAMALMAPTTRSSFLRDIDPRGERWARSQEPWRVRVDQLYQSSGSHISTRTKDDGVLVGTSYFPKTFSYRGVSPNLAFDIFM